ncbi:MAG: hypothetical protein GX591_12165 [Planctomycetes bacterium]|nr:hypothetical protein [Planctomycetota bacterium]
MAEWSEDSLDEDEWSDEPLDEDEFPDEADLADDGDEVLGSLVPCPHCGRAMYEEAPRCPMCGQWVSRHGRWRTSRKVYVRGGLWLARLLLANWLLWIALSAAAVVLWWMGRE